MGMLKKLMGKDESTPEAEAEVNRNFMKEQQITDIATANEQIDHIQQDQRSDLLKWQQDLDDEINKLRHRLKGEVLKSDKTWGPRFYPTGKKNEEGKEILETLPPLANDLFIDYVETQVDPFMSRNLFCSNLDQKRILLMLRNTCDDIADAMADGYDIYGIEFINYDLVMRLIKNVIIPGPFRAMNDGQRRHDRTIAKRIEAFNEKGFGKDQKKAFMGVNLT